MIKKTLTNPLIYIMACALSLPACGSKNTVKIISAGNDKKPKIINQYGNQLNYNFAVGITKDGNKTALLIDGTRHSLDNIILKTGNDLEVNIQSGNDAAETALNYVDGDISRSIKVSGNKELQPNLAFLVCYDNCRDADNEDFRNKRIVVTDIETFRSIDFSGHDNNPSLIEIISGDNAVNYAVHHVGADSDFQYGVKGEVVEVMNGTSDTQKDDRILSLIPKENFTDPTRIDALVSEVKMDKKGNLAFTYTTHQTSFTRPGNTDNNGSFGDSDSD